MALKQVKNKIIATKKTGQVTKAMEAVSAVKMRKSQERAFVGRPYVRSALNILSRLSASRDGLSHPFAKVRPSGKHLLIMVTSDKGLAGSVNSAVQKKVDEIIASGENLEILAIGRKAVEYANREGVTLLGDYINVADGVALSEVDSMANKVLSLYESPEYQKVSIIYQNFLSTFEQLPTLRTVLPLNPDEIKLMMEGIKPKTGKWNVVESNGSETTDYMVEPSSEEVLNVLIPQLVSIIIYHALLESKASEHSARMVAMKNATDKSKEMIKSLTIKYNKARQAAITAEVSEITAGAEAMKT
ncbi:ATP synthase F1 subunit gamma [Candidatus Kaiserbacteria bacterium CG10_big_fil_rev_8_21_14_0_10_44_10]|uniref:ATP synthase gamma chain n=1 Tax=Candidatus Kaiserbacteria bacterium CG10_big_fil_rev_8_21_14_0_10_44_10 TaxID=1974606 RepID=A0A2H0UHA0_9BACT|nr:MAG: ATP synthase F1 subunit gamma [Candidatus Kaiserbacteria bacterium CG10_big_fil_rev_8_21_14_0_10_44_10]